MTTEPSRSICENRFAIFPILASVLWRFECFGFADNQFPLDLQPSLAAARKELNCELSTRQFIERSSYQALKVVPDENINLFDLNVRPLLLSLIAPSNETAVRLTHATLTSIFFFDNHQALKYQQSTAMAHMKVEMAFSVRFSFSSSRLCAKTLSQLIFYCIVGWREP